MKENKLLILQAKSKDRYNINPIVVDEVVPDLMVWPQIANMDEIITSAAPTISQELPTNSVISDVLFFDGTYIPAVKALFTTHGYLRPIETVRLPPPIKLKNRRYAQSKTIKMELHTPNPAIKKIMRIPEEPVQETKFMRPPAVYSNIPSPYGLATEMLREQLKKTV